MLTRRIARKGMALIFLCAALLRGSFAFGTELPENGTMENSVQTNVDTLYTTYDFGALHDGRTSWEVVDRVGNPKPKKFIYVWPQSEKGSFMANIQINRAIMKEIFSRWPVSDFEGIGFIGHLDGPPDWSWEIPIAIASTKSADYKDFKAHYPNSRVTDLFGLYDQFANDTKVYEPIQKLFREFGADIEFEGGDKEVLNARAENLPFYPQLKAIGINGKTRVIYDARGNSFTIKPWPNKPVQSAAAASK